MRKLSERLQRRLLKSVLQMKLRKPPIEPRNLKKIQKLLLKKKPNLKMRKKVPSDPIKRNSSHLRLCQRVLRDLVREVAADVAEKEKVAAAEKEEEEKEEEAEEAEEEEEAQEAAAKSRLEPSQHQNLQLHLPTPKTTRLLLLPTTRLLMPLLPTTSLCLTMLPRP